MSTLTFDEAKTFVVLLNVDCGTSTFYFYLCGIATFTKVKNLRNSSITAYYLPTLQWRDREKLGGLVAAGKEIQREWRV